MEEKDIDQKFSLSMRIDRYPEPSPLPVDFANDSTVFIFAPIPIVAPNAGGSIEHLNRPLNIFSGSQSSSFLDTRDNSHNSIRRRSTGSDASSIKTLLNALNAVSTRLFNIIAELEFGRAVNVANSCSPSPPPPSIPPLINLRTPKSLLRPQL